MRSPLVIFVAIVALVVGAFGVIDLLSSKPQPAVTTEVVGSKENQYVAVWMTTHAYQRGDEITSQGVIKKQMP